jgi:hypothetical protein
MEGGLPDQLFAEGVPDIADLTDAISFGAPAPHHIGKTGGDPAQNRAVKVRPSGGKPLVDYQSNSGVVRSFRDFRVV